MKKNFCNKNNINRILSNLVYPLISVIVIIAVWMIIATIKGNPLVLPMPDKVLYKFFNLWTEPEFIKSVGATLWRTFIAFIISFALSLFLSILSGIYLNLNKFLAPVVAFLRAAPTVAVILIIYAFMNTDAMAIVVGALIAFPIMYSNFYSAITGIDPDKIKMAKIYKINFVPKIINIYLIPISDCIFDTARSTLSLTLKVIISAEILTCISTGIGGKIQTAYATFEISYLLAWTSVAILFSFVLELFAELIKKLCIRWK